ncbi:MAG: hypothetical protein K0R54_4563 [Clostridiaceae bacterium]|nr:hypothetical protein [Clostridiaceae bacterium]
MYNVIIVEDDAIVRTYLSGLLQWESHGMKIAGEFTNGREAMQFIEKQNVDIVITDVSMPVMSGIDLIKNIKNSKKFMKIIVLSCHSDYDFIREALKCGVSDYILKQYLTKETLLELLEKLIGELEINKNSVIYEKEANDTIKSNLLKNIINGIARDENDAIEELPSMRYFFNTSKYFVAIAKFDDFLVMSGELVDEQLKKYNSQIIEIIKAIIMKNGNGIAALTKNNEFTILLSFDTNADLGIIIEKVNEMMCNIRTEVMNTIPYSISIGISNLCCDFSQVAEAYKHTQNMIEGYMLFHKGKISFLKDQKKCSYYALTLEDEKNLLRVITEENINEAVALIEGYLNKFKNEYEDLKMLKVWIIDLINVLTRISMKCDIDPQVLFQTDYIPYEEIESKQNIEDIKNWFVSIIKKIVDINNGENNLYRSEILKAVEYIEKHCTEEIYLRDVANHVNISPNYFSMLFKKEMGVVFSEYLLDIRLGKAKLFLKKKGIKIYEAAFKAGFYNNQYFNRVFKQKYGLTPLAFKRQSEQQERGK